MRSLRISRIYSGECQQGPRPQLCDACKEKNADRLANALLNQRFNAGALVLIPKRWHVKYCDGTLVSGKVLGSSEQGDSN